MFMFQKGEQFVFVALKSFEKSFDVFILIVVRRKNLFKPAIQSTFQVVVFFRFQLTASLRKPDGIFEQPKQPFSEGLPVCGPVGFIHFSQFGEQMIETSLLCQGGDFVIGAPEVADQDPPENAAQDLPDDR